VSGERPAGDGCGTIGCLLLIAAAVVVASPALIALLGALR
jgi:hypothetical protein